MARQEHEREECKRWSGVEKWLIEYVRTSRSVFVKEGPVERSRSRGREEEKRTKTRQHRCLMRIYIP
jgi:hypothetical protein